MFSFLTEGEAFWLFLLILGIIIQLATSYFHRDNMTLFSPMTVVSLTYIYYCTIGPILAIINEETVLRIVDHRIYFETAWKWAAISFWSIFLSFSLGKFKKFKKIKLVINENLLISESRYIFIFSLVLLVLFSGPDFYKKINFLDNENSSGGVAGTFLQYLMQAIIFFIAPCIMALFAFLKGKKRIYFIFYFLFAFSLFLNEAFRYRLVVLMVAVFFAYHIIQNRKLNITLSVAIVVPFVLLMGVMELARNYGRGLDLSRLENTQDGAIVDRSFSESAVFMATGYLIDNYDQMYDHSHFDFVANAIAMPIPRAIWNNKPSGEYLLNVLSGIYYGYDSGQAILNYGEYYIAFGFEGIIIMSIVIGLFLKYIWQWFLNNRENYLAIIVIVIFNGMVYVLISRGYFAQYVTLVLYALFPIWLVKKRIKKKYTN